MSDELLRFQSTRPARGATATSVALADLCQVSNHAPRGARLLLVPPRKPHILFQSTRPRGARPPDPSLVYRLAFHPRARAGATFSFYWSSTQCFSIHAPRGATASLYRLLAKMQGFNPRARAGATSGDSRVPVFTHVQSSAPRARHSW
jgi:hypothetical protein